MSKEMEWPLDAPQSAEACGLVERLNELEAENERLKRHGFLARVAAYFDASDLAASFMSEDGDGGFVAAIHGMTKEIERLRAEALASAGAVKVSYDALIQVLLDLQYEGLCRDRDIEPIADRILSALEPHPRATNTVDAHETENVSDKPEGQQEPVAYRVHAPEDEYYGTGPDRLQFHPLTQHDLNNGYRQTPLYTRPSEQAVTEAMVEAAAIAISGGRKDLWDGFDLFKRASFRTRALHALKAAMEAGRSGPAG